ncbi:MAG: mobile mystery protein B [Chitinophagaceae bacterium]
MGLELIYDEGQTPLDEEEKEGLLLKTISTRAELDEAEQLNIEEALEWTMKKNFSIRDILSEDFINGLHKRMYRDVWRWAGDFRKTEKNIGIDWTIIPIELKTLIDDCKFWIENKIFSDDEISIRFKHRLVSIHCYSNGNGRHSRLIADVTISHVCSKPVFTWGTGDLVKAGQIRKKYIESLRAADKGNYDQLLAFSRT